MNTEFQEFFPKSYLDCISGLPGKENFDQRESISPEIYDVQEQTRRRAGGYQDILEQLFPASLEAETRDCTSGRKKMEKIKNEQARQKRKQKPAGYYKGEKQKGPNSAILITDPQEIAEIERKERKEAFRKKEKERATKDTISNILRLLEKLYG